MDYKRSAYCEEDKRSALNLPPSPVEKRELEIVWRNVIIFLLLHMGGIYGLYLSKDNLPLLVYTCIFLIPASGLGITAGAHRLWAHKSYKAKLPLRILLVVLNSLAGQDAVIDWVRDHRMHHKYTETDSDPHNATRGFFFSHIGWLMVRKHPKIKAKKDTIDMSDLWADPVLRFQKKYYGWFMLIFTFLLPTVFPHLMWNAPLWDAFFICTILRYVYTLNITWLVNSAAHMFGTKPYDKNINPVETELVSFFSLGEGFHNYHHTFPWDYKAAELGYLNFSKVFIDTMAKIGWAYDLKTVSEEVIKQRVKRTGDGSHAYWGWDDEDVPTSKRNETIIIYSESRLK